MADTMRHEHRWIDVSHLGENYERRLCMTCNQEERRHMPAQALADGSLADAEWETIRQGAGQVSATA
jgi:hypothetical protein